MHFHFSFYSSLLLILFSQGILFSILLWRKGITLEQSSYYWLSLFIFLCSCFLLPWMLGHAGWYSLQPYRDILFYVPTQQQFLLGPVIFFYTQSLLNKSFRLHKWNCWHFLPALLYLLYSLIVFVTDKLVLKEYFFYADGRDKDLDTWYQVAGSISIIIYGLLSLRYYGLYKKLLYQATSFADTFLFGWVRKYLIAFFLMQAIILCLLIFYPRWGSFTQKWWYYFLFGCMYYYIALTAITSNQQSVIAFYTTQLFNSPVYLLQKQLLYLPTNSFSDNNTQEIILEPQQEEVATLNPELEKWKAVITDLLDNKKMYEEPELTLQMLAEKAGTNIAVISKTVNQGFGQNFNDLVNSFRVEAVQQLFLKGEHQNQTLLSIAYECGFNSKTTFNRVFKKITGVSPKDFIKTAEKEDGTN